MFEIRNRCNISDRAQSWGPVSIGRLTERFIAGLEARAAMPSLPLSSSYAGRVLLDRHHSVPVSKGRQAKRQLTCWQHGGKGGRPHRQRCALRTVPGKALGKHRSILMPFVQGLIEAELLVAPAACQPVAAAGTCESKECCGGGSCGSRGQRWAHLWISGRILTTPRMCSAAPAVDVHSALCYGEQHGGSSS